MEAPPSNADLVRIKRHWAVLGGTEGYWVSTQYTECPKIKILKGCIVHNAMENSCDVLKQMG